MILTEATRLKIYFAGAIRGGRDDREHYERIVDHLRSRGTVLTEHVADANLVAGERHLSDVEICERDLAWLKEADVIVAEVTKPSLGVGYELARAGEFGVPALCLFRDGTGTSLSAMISGDRRFWCETYDDIRQVADRIDTFLAAQGWPPPR